MSWKIKFHGFIHSGIQYSLPEHNGNWDCNLWIPFLKWKSGRGAKYAWWIGIPLMNLNYLKTDREESCKCRVCSYNSIIIFVRSSKVCVFSPIYFYQMISGYKRDLEPKIQFYNSFQSLFLIENYVEIPKFYPNSWIEFLIFI